MRRVHYEAENEREMWQKRGAKSVAKVRKGQIKCEKWGESWVVFDGFLTKVTPKLAVFCRNLRFLKKGCRAFATVGWLSIINISLY